MTRKILLLAVVAMLAMGTSAALALGSTSTATTDATVAQETTTAAGGQTTAAEGQTTAAPSANVTFANQTSNGTAVTVERVVVPEGGFVVIHAGQNVSDEVVAENETEFEGVTQTQTTVAEVNQTQGYAPGAVLGNSTYLEPGVHEDVTVRLDQPLQNQSQILIAMPHRDTNANQQYDFPEADAPYTEDGQPVTDWASVTLEETANRTTTAAGTETTTEEM